MVSVLTIFMFSASDDAEKPAATGGSHERGNGSSSSKSEINHIFEQLIN